MTRIEGYTCDAECGITGTTEGGIGSRPPGWVVVYGPGPTHHFCSWRCLATFTATAGGSGLHALDAGIR